MNKIIFLIVSLMIFCMILIFSGKAVAQEVISSDEIQKYLAKLESLNFSERAEAVNFFYYYYMSREIDPEVLKKLVDTFLYETRNRKNFISHVLSPKKNKESLPKELLYMNNDEWGIYIDLLTKMVRRSKDPRLLPVLVESWLDPEALGNYGDLAVEAIINKIKSNPDDRGITGYVLVLKAFINNEITSYQAWGEVREKIKKTLMEVSTSDKHWHIRQIAVEALGESGDADVIPFLEKVASSDELAQEIEVPSADKSAPPQKKIRYPVREEAQRQLEKLKKKISGKIREEQIFFGSIA